MKTIVILTPANIELEYRLAGVGSRLAAFIIDFTLQLLAIALAAGIILLGFDRRILGNTTPSGAALGAVLITYFVIHFGYFSLCEMAWNGQSVGKRIFGLRAIRENGQPLTLANVLVRALFRASIDMMYIGVFTIMFSKLHKRLGDMAAGTVVVSEQPATAPSLTPPSYGTPDFLANYALALTPQERLIIEMWQRRKNELPDNGANIQARLAEYFAQKNTPIEEVAVNGDNS
ncbi:MAG: RDD family protein [Defluviitaleaceae bacterium]|nr:RDD family protein [Defluviitaleaceae bacterium]MCL2261969.1 RDD family protein [Defluviitaleaceae bacterium]